MGQVRGINKKKYDKILAARDMIDDALDFDKKLKKISNSLKQFEKDLHPFKEKEQKKIREY
jgi:hypothetical protein